MIDKSNQGVNSSLSVNKTSTSTQAPVDNNNVVDSGEAKSKQASQLEIQKSQTGVIRGSISNSIAQNSALQSQDVLKSQDSVAKNEESTNLSVQATNASADAQLESNSQSNEAETLKKQAEGESNKAKKEQLKEQSKQAEIQAQELQYEAEKQTNEAELQSQSAQAFQEEADEFTASANTKDVAISNDTQALAKTSTELNSIDSQISSTKSGTGGGSATSGNSTKSGTGGGSSGTTVSSSTLNQFGVGGSGEDFQSFGNSPGASFLSSAMGILQALANMNNQKFQAVNHNFQVANALTSKTMAQQGKSTVEAGLAQEINGTSNVAFKLRMVDSQFSAMTGKLEEDIKYHEEDAKQNFITAPKQTHDFFKPA